MFKDEQTFSDTNSTLNGLSQEDMEKLFPSISNKNEFKAKIKPEIASQTDLMVTYDFSNYNNDLSIIKANGNSPMSSINYAPDIDDIPENIIDKDFLLQKAQEEIIDYQEQLEEKEEQLHNHILENSQLNDTISNLNKELKEKDLNIEQLKQNDNLLNSEIKNLEIQLDTSENKFLLSQNSIAKLEEALIYIKESRDKYQIDVDKYTKTNYKLSSNIETLKRDLNETNDKLNDVTIKHTLLNNQYQTVQDEMLNLLEKTENKTQLLIELDNLQASRNNIKSEVEELFIISKQQEELIQMQTETKDKLSELKSSLETRVSELEKQKKNYEENIDKHKKEYYEYIHSKEPLIEAYNNCHTKCQSMIIWLCVAIGVKLIWIYTSLNNDIISILLFIIVICVIFFASKSILELKSAMNSLTNIQKEQEGTVSK